MHDSRRTVRLSLAAFAGALLAGCASQQIVIPLDEAEEEISRDDVPTSAIAALRAESGGRAFTEFEREMRAGVAHYEAEWMVGDMEHEATVLADGSLVETEADIRLADTPPAVRARIRELRDRGYDGFTVARRTFILYEIEATRGGSGEDDDDDGEELEVLVRPDGAEAR